MLYCMLSGLSPFMIYPLDDIAFSVYSDLGPLTRKAWKDIVNDQMIWDTIEMSLIGPTDEASKRLVGGDKLSDADIRIIPIEMGHRYEWDEGWPTLVQSIDGTDCTISLDRDIIVASVALSTLFLATNGRVTPQRIWRMAMCQGRPFADLYCYGFNGIKYYYAGIIDGRDDIPMKTPGFWECIWINGHDNSDLMELEELGDSEAIRQRIIWEGKYWVWMRPDRFPLNTTLSHQLIPILLAPPTHLHPLSKIEQLPFEILVEITSHCSLLALLCLFSTSRHIRSKHLAQRSARDHIASAWIKMSAPWYEKQSPEKVHRNRREIGQRMGWTYLQRCIDSGSMMNRKRIWWVAEQLERKADDMGI